MSCACVMEGSVGVGEILRNLLGRSVGARGSSLVVGAPLGISKGVTVGAKGGCAVELGKGANS